MKYLVQLILLTTVLLASPASSQQADDAPSQDAMARIDALLEEIERQEEDIEVLAARASRREGVAAELLMSRRDRVWAAMLANTATVARELIKRRDAGEDVSAYWDPMVADLEQLPEEMRAMLERVREQVVFPDGDLPTSEFVIADQELFREVAAQQRLLSAMIDYVEIADEFGLDVSAEREFVETELAEHAANASVFLALAQDALDALQAASATLPGNTEITDRLNATNARIRLSAGALQGAVALLDRLDLQTRLYRQQLLTATGEITADVLDVGLVASLVSEWSRAAIGYTRANGPQLLFRTLFIVVILFAFWQLGKLLQRLLEKALSSSRVTISTLLQKMIVSTARNLVFAIGFMLAISQLGVSLGPLLAGLGIAGFIIGFALQDTLSNFASGVMILFYRPFDVGDYVEAGGVTGKVSHMSLVNTTFMTLDNQRLIVPNNMIWQTVITNVTAQHVRRVDLMFGVSYSDDLDKVEQLLHDIVAEHEAVLSEPEPMIKLHELADSSVNFIVRPWVKTEDYWDTYWAITKAVKKRFDAEGISIPFPQRDVHVIESPG
ncbi:MAG: mechanosensitive ion channel family protein [Woeseiaceae bacterium]